MKIPSQLLIVCLLSIASVNAQYSGGSPGSTDSDADKRYRQSQADDARREAAAREQAAEAGRQQKIIDQQNQIDAIRRQQQQRQ